jgi:hypothetical protein
MVVPSCSMHEVCGFDNHIEWLWLTKVGTYTFSRYLQRASQQS